MNRIQDFGYVNRNKENYNAEKASFRNSRKNGRKDKAADYVMSEQAKKTSPEELKEAQAKANGVSLEKSRKASMEDGLSEKAKNLLKELREKYGNIDFFVADFANDEEANAYHRLSTKQYSCVIDPVTLEEMASDEKVKEKYVGVIDGAEDQFSKMKDELKEDITEVERFGINVDKDGVVTYFAQLKTNPRLEKEASLKKEKSSKNSIDEGKKTEKPKKEKKNSDVIKASTLDELLQKIKVIFLERTEEKTNENSEEKKNKNVVHFDVEL